MSKPTPKMSSYIEKLLKMKDWEQQTILQIAPTRDMSYHEASALINYLKGCPWRPRNGSHGAASSEPVTEAGMYRSEGVIYKVQVAVHGSGHLYAKRLERFGEGNWQFVYERGAIRRLSASDKMTLEEAKEFGALYGTCCVCGRTLTREESIEAGIGPVCASKGGWA